MADITDGSPKGSSLKNELKPNYGTASSQEAGLAHNDSRDYRDSSSSSELSDDVVAPTVGVKAIEAISQAWSGWWLVVAYAGIVLVSNVQSLEQATTINVAPTATSAFSQLPALSTLSVVQSVLLSTVKPVMAKISDVIGRLEAFSLAVLLYVLGYIQQACSQNIDSYIGAQVFYAAGQTGLQILVQVFVADTTDLLNRAFFSTIPDVPFLWTTWVGPFVADALVAINWRWGYGIWAILLPVSILPLLTALYLNKQKAKRLGYYPVSPYRGKSFINILVALWFDLDVFGLLLLTALISLILIPLTLGPQYGWDNPSYVAMFCVGGACLIAFPFWERSKKLAPKAFFPKDIFRNRTVMVGATIAFFYFMAFYLSVFPYFNPYLRVVEQQSITAAGRITQTFSFTATVSSLIISVIIKYTAHYKYFITLGSIVYTVGIGLMIVYRHEGVGVGTLVGCQIAVGIGGGMLNVPTQLGVQASVNHQEVAAATAVWLTILEIGGAVGAAISGAIWSSQISSKLARYLPASSQQYLDDIVGDVDFAANYKRFPLGDPTRTAINRTYDETMHQILIVGVSMAALLIPLSLLMKNYKLDQIDQKVKGRVIGGKKDTVGLPEVAGASEAPVAFGEITKKNSPWPWKRDRSD